MKEESTDRTARWLLGGGILAALAATSCCIGPALFMLLGLSGFTVAGFYETGRPWLLALSALILTFAWYRMFFGKASCPEGGKCSIRKSSKINMIVLVLVTLAAIGFGAFPQLAEFTAQGNEPLPAVKEKYMLISQERLEVSIAGMDCPFCAAGIEQILNRTAGVIDASVIYDARQATVLYDATRTTPDQIIKAIGGIGFEAQAVN